MPKFILRALDGQPLPIHGSGSQQRGFVYVDDAAAAFEAIAARGKGLCALSGALTRFPSHTRPAYGVHGMASLLLLPGKVGAIYNVGTSEELTILQVASDICELGGRDAKEAVVHVEVRKRERRRPCLSST